MENSGGEFVAAQIGGEAELFVGLDRVGPFVLELIGPEFVQQPDAKALPNALSHEPPAALPVSQA